MYIDFTQNYKTEVYAIVGKMFCFLNVLQKSSNNNNKKVNRKKNTHVDNTMQENGLKTQVTKLILDFRKMYRMVRR